MGFTNNNALFFLTLNYPRLSQLSQPVCSRFPVSILAFRVVTFTWNKGSFSAVNAFTTKLNEF